MKIEVLQVERTQLIDNFTKNRHAMSDDEKMAFHNSLAEIDTLISQLEYQSMTNDEKIGYWTNAIYRQMRVCGESGIEELSILNERLLRDLRLAEPDIEKFLPVVLANLSSMWLVEAGAFFDLVNRQMGTRFVRPGKAGSS